MVRWCHAGTRAVLDFDDVSFVEDEAVPVMLALQDGTSAVRFQQAIGFHAFTSDLGIPPGVRRPCLRAPKPPARWCSQCRLTRCQADGVAYLNL